MPDHLAIAADAGTLGEARVAVQVSKLVFDYDQLIIVGPVFPHEAVGFSGGNKYLFPGVSGPDVQRLLSLARRGGDQPEDHRGEVDARARRRRV